MRVFAAEELPRFASTRDTRARLDLATAEGPMAAERLKADRIVYHPGDSSARHYHVGCDHLFVMLSGEAVFHRDDETTTLRAGDVAVVRERQLHWFENRGDADFSFVELWAPPPAETVWVDAGDI
jgi:mannose-6-phosphate isomerase-like protein (cupin superfamily)